MNRAKWMKLEAEWWDLGFCSVKPLLTWNRTGVNPSSFNPLNAELNPICHLLALLAHHILHVSRVRVNSYNHHFPVNQHILYCSDISLIHHLEYWFTMLSDSRPTYPIQGVLQGMWDFNLLCFSRVKQKWLIMNGEENCCKEEAALFRLHTNVPSERIGWCRTTNPESFN